MRWRMGLARAGLSLGAAMVLQAETELEKAARLMQARDAAGAQAVLERLVQAEPRNAEAWFRLGQLHAAKGEARKAVDCADRALALDPSKADYHVLRGNALGNLAQSASMFKALGLASDGRAALEKAVQLEPANRPAVLALFNWYFNVPAIGGGSVDKAKALAVRTTALDPSRGHYLQGLVHQKQKDPGAAQAAFRRALAADPSFSAVYNALGYVELEMKQVDQALEHFQRQVALDPANPNCYDSLGDGLMAAGRREEAIAAYRKALALNPLYVPSMRSLGRVLEQAGRKDEAIAHYRACLQLGTQRGLPQVVSESKARLKALGVEG